MRFWFVSFLRKKKKIELNRVVVSLDFNQFQLYTYAEMYSRVIASQGPAEQARNKKFDGKNR